MSNAFVALNGSMLPPEIIQQIFRHACQISTPFAYNLCLVSSWTRQFALPLLYSFVQIDSEARSASLLETLKLPALMKPLNGAMEEDFIPTDRISAIQFTTDNMGAVFKPFDHCVASTGTLCIAVNAESLYNLFIMYGYVFDAFRWQRALLQRNCEYDLLVQTAVALNITNLWNSNHIPRSPYRKYGGISPFSPLLDKITALRLAAFQPGEHRHPPFPYVKHFVALTHLALPVEDLERNSREIIDLFEHRTLEVLVLVILKDRVLETGEVLEGWAAGLRNSSRKVRIYLDESDSKSLVSGWEREQRGGRSMWDRRDS